MAIKSSNLLTTKPSPLTAMVTLLILFILAFYTLHFPHPSLSNKTTFQNIFLSSSSNSTISTYLRTLTMHPHLAGTKPNSKTATFLLNHFSSLNLPSHTTSYKTLLSYPLHSSLTAHFSNHSSPLNLPLTEPSAPSVVHAYHAYSPSGSVFAKPVFVNYGRDIDYRALGVDVKGCIVILRKGGNLGRSAMIEKAEANGAVAVLIYNDEGDTWRNGFERGHVMKGVGDPLSPGWGSSVDGSERLSLEDNEVLKRFPKIPSMPLSAEVADTVLSSLGGSPVPLDWRDAFNSKVTHVGPGPTMLNFTYLGEMKVATIQNVFAVIKGSEEPDRHVLLGNHRDAWTYGAVDPSSGTAALLDLARRFSILLSSGWKPRRTIILCSWDAEEFGMIGSTEWVEQNLINLGSKAVAYLNVDCAVQGPGFFVGSTPQLDSLILEVIKKVKDPDSEGVSVYDTWAAAAGGNNIQRLGRVDSDFAPFVQHAGVPSVDVYYGKDFPVYHTAFDSYNWMAEYGDPFFQRHVAVTGIWGLLALRLADDSILPFDYLSYANELQLYRDILSNMLDQKISVHPLTSSIEEFASAAKEVDDELKELRLLETAGQFVDMKRRAMNDRLMLAEKGFLDGDGLEGKQWFKHLVFGPPNDPEKLDFFPGIADSITRSASTGERERLAEIQHEIWRVARAIQRATSALRGEFT
ncbi:probable glutamate carboxypeptidase AMP1 isoform X2 [Cicer arietinum]|uniref:glutamate carboxypeptidase II n=1 Tax=Cicer arietinum TaxID=3827 RepID=A0A1S2XTG2_CICAR|nr:probable glutamate carboxypeptidase AMP1 isoform X2 [Cicer arietinum]